MFTWMIAIGGAGALFGILAALQVVKIARIKGARVGEGFEEFAARIAGRGVPEEVQREVVAYIQGREFPRKVPVRPEDDLARVYGIVDEDVYDAVVRISAKAGRIPPSGIDNAVKGIVSVGDLAEYVAKLPLRV